MNKRKLISVLVLPFVIMIVGYFLIVAVRLIPKSLIYDNIYETILEMESEGMYPDVYVEGTNLDNWTDADCLAIILNAKTDNVFFNALYPMQLRFDGENVIRDVILTMENADNYTVSSHSYLWNGFQIWLKPLFLHYNIAEIRSIMSWIILVLIILISIYIYAVERRLLAVLPFLFSVMFFNFVFESLSFLYFNDICISLVACVYIIKQYERKDINFGVFTIIGSSVAFTSMIILPMITIGYPLIFYLYYFMQDRSFVDKFKRMIINVICWFWGYSSVILSKLLISKFICESEVGGERVSTYCSGSLMDRVHSILPVIKLALKSSWISTELLFVVMILFLFLVIYRKPKKECYKIYMFYILICLIPLVWCFVMPGHSGHGWTKFNYCISIYAFLQGLYFLQKNHRDIVADSKYQI